MDIVERLRTKKEQYIATVEWGVGNVGRIGGLR